MSLPLSVTPRLATAALVLGLALATAAGAVPRCDGAAAQPLPREGFVEAVRRNSPAVVQVVVLRGARDPMEESEGFEFFQPMAGTAAAAGEAMDRSFSSGFFIEPDGLLLSSAHAVFDAREIWVVTAEGRRLRARVLGLDRRRDVALLKVDATGLPVVHAGSVASLCPGAWVVALGSPFGFDQTATAGVVSSYPRFLHGSSIPLVQSDVVLNPGSSGGPVFDAGGALVGMSTMIFSATGIYVGVSFALPVDELMRTADALRRHGTVTRGDIGARTQPITPELARAFGLEGTDGALVARVDAGGPAAQAGLRPGDVVLGLAHGERLTHEEIERRLAAAAPGTHIAPDVWRDGEMHRIAIDIAAAQAPPAPAVEARRASQEPRLGLGLATLSSAQGGLAPGLYVDTADGSALLAGVERGDRVLAVNGTPVATTAQFDAALARVAKRPVIALLLLRGGTMVYVPVSREGLAD